MEGRAHVAPHGEALDAPEVGLLDPGTVDTAPSSRRVVHRLAAFAAVAAAALVGLGLTMLRSSYAVGGKLPKGTILTQDFRLLHDDHFIQYDPKMTRESNTDAAFDHFISSSGFGDELSDDEKVTYRTNFVGLMELMTKDLNRGTDVDAEQWQSWLKTATEDEKPVVTDAFVDHINRQDLGFKVAKLPAMGRITNKDMNMRLGAVVPPKNPRKKAQSAETASTIDVPTSFASFDKWPDCRETIRREHNQGECGSCWAFAALAVLDSRLCIKTQGHPGGQFTGVGGMLSRTYATSCTYDAYDGCQGGDPAAVFKLVGTHGAPTGGDEGCIPYFGSGNGIDHFDTQFTAPPCPGECKRASYPRALHNDKFVFGGEGTWYQTELRQVQQHMVTDGPVAALVVGKAAEFKAYASGILRAGGCRGEPLDHAVAAIGYGGDTCGGDPGACGSFYWRLRNSWGDWWGDGGEISVAPCEILYYEVPGAITDAHLSEGLPDPTLPGGDDGGEASCEDTSGGAVGSAGGGCEFWTDQPQWCFRSQYYADTDFTATDMCCACGGGLADDAPFDLSLFKEKSECLPNGPEYEAFLGMASSPDDCATKCRERYGADCEYVIFGIDAKLGKCFWESAEACEGGQFEQDSYNVWRIELKRAEESVFHVVEGNCKIEDGCALSPNFPQRYASSDSCTIEVTVEQGIQISFLAFHTESGYDVLTANGYAYSGDLSTGEKYGIHASGTITWTTDFSVESTGWKLCHGVEPTKDVTCEGVFDDLELAEGGKTSVTCPEGCGSSSGVVWGSNPYTSDSLICKSAAHFGKDGGVIEVSAIGTRSGFKGSHRNGISSSQWSDKWTAVSIT